MPGLMSEWHPTRFPSVQGYNIVAFINYDTKQVLQTGLSPRKHTDPENLSDQPLLFPDERVGLINGDFEQICDSLRGCQSEPTRM